MDIGGHKLDIPFGDRMVSGAILCFLCCSMLPKPSFFSRLQHVQQMLKLFLTLISMTYRLLVMAHQIAAQVSAQQQQQMHNMII